MPTLADLKGFNWTHAAIRADLDVLETKAHAVETATPKDRKRYLNYVLYHAAMLKMHHDGEEQYFFPKLRTPDTADAFDRLHAEHEAVLPLLQKLETIAKSDKTEASFPSDVIAYAKAVRDHLADEERMAAAYVESQENFDRWIELEHGYQQHIPKAELMLALPWLVERLSESDRPVFLSRLPAMVRMAYPAMIAPAFRARLP